MEHVLGGLGYVYVVLIGLASVASLGIALYWIWNKNARQRQLAVLRKRLDEMEPTDPQYDKVERSTRP